MRFFDQHVRPYDHLDDDQLSMKLARTRRQMRVADAPFAAQVGWLCVFAGIIFCLVAVFAQVRPLAWGAGPALIVCGLAFRVWRSTLLQQGLRQERELHDRAASREHLDRLHAGAFSGMMLFEASSYLTVRHEILSLACKDRPAPDHQGLMEDALEERLFLLRQLQSQMDPAIYQAHAALASMLLEGYGKLAQIVCSLGDGPTSHSLPGMDELASLAEAVSDRGRQLGADPRHLHDIDCLLADIKLMQER